MKSDYIIIAIPGCIMAAICASLGWFGVTEQQLTTTVKYRGIATYHGLAAVIQGWFWFAGSVFFLGVSASVSRFRNLIWFVLAVLYIASLAAYVIWFYQPLSEL